MGASPVPRSFPADSLISGSSDGSSSGRGDGEKGGESHCSEDHAAFRSSLLPPNSYSSFCAALHREGRRGCSFSHPPSAPSSCSPSLLPRPKKLPGAEQPPVTHSGDVAALGIGFAKAWGNVTAVSPATPAPPVPAGRWRLGLSAGTQLIRSFQ